MEFNGIRLDVPLLRKLGDEMAGHWRRIEKEIYDLAGHEFNIGSLPQLRKVLFEELKLPVQGKTGVTGAPSTDQETLEKLAALDHPGAKLPRKILEQRQIAKLKGTYVDALPDLVNPKTQRIHASFNQTVAATGRLVCQRPEPAEHPRTPGDGAADPSGVRPRAGLGVSDRRLFADRAAAAGPLLSRRGAAKGVRGRSRRPCRRGGADFLRAGGGCYLRATTYGQDGELRRHLRHQSAGAGAAAADLAR